MSEKINETSPELAKQASELERARSEVERAAAEQLEKRAETATAEHGPERVDTARHEALERAHSSQEREVVAVETPAERKQFTKADREASYQHTMKQMRTKLSPSSHAFSKVIHSPVVEKTSDIVGNTVARPNLIIAGALGAILSVIVYFIAKRYGYVLSGSETIILFVCGWIVGALFEYVRVGFSGRKNT